MAVKPLRILALMHEDLVPPDDVRLRDSAHADWKMEFDVTVTLCFTPAQCGVLPHHTSPPQHPEAFADFCAAMVRRYA